LEPGNSFIQIVAGTAMFSVLEDSSALFEISTPTVSIRPLRQGLYRIEVRQDGSTDVIVRSGEAEIFTANDTRRLESGRALAVIGDPASPDLVALGNLPFDEWDRWNEARDRDLARNDSYRYVSRDIYGAEDLGRYGRWVYDSPYGWVWAPAVQAGWAPYRVGRWSWVDYYGWTWISADPWAWAPYHYGRWYHAAQHGWVWYPGGRRERHYWRPALVAFFGWNSGRISVGVSVGFGNLGWVPLAPREIYRPWYGRSGPRNVTVNNVVVVNNVNIVETYRNARFIDGRTAVTSVSSRTFGRGRVTTENIVRVTNRDLSRVAQVRGQVPVEPSSESRRYSDRTVRARAVPQAETAVAMSARRGGGGETTRVAAGATTSVNAAAPSRPTARVSPSNAAAGREPARGTVAPGRRAETPGAEGAPVNPQRGNASRIAPSGQAGAAADPGVTPRRSTGATAPAVRAGSEGAPPAGRTAPLTERSPRRAEGQTSPGAASTERRSQSPAGREVVSPSTEAQRAPTRRIVPSAEAGSSGGGSAVSRRVPAPALRSSGSGESNTAAVPVGRSAPSAEQSPRRVESRATPEAPSTVRRSESPAPRETPSPSTEAQRVPAQRSAPSAGAGPSSVRGNSEGRSNARSTSQEPTRVERPQSPARQAPSPSAAPQRDQTRRDAPAPVARPSGQNRGAVSRGNADSGGNPGNVRARR
jgi:hypothetical protein